jgi:diguanylate cyclase (GGDEF)-like protein
MQPGTTQTARTLSWFNALLLTFGGLIIIAISVIIWLLAMRTRLLQRAVSRRTAALRRAMERLRGLATTDELTGLSNRRAFLERWQFEYERAVRYGRPLECLVIDVDGFKSINDTAGHPMGDAVLTQVAQELQASLRQSDVLARFGGDEFIVALPETSVAQAVLVAEKLRKLHLRGPWERFPGLGPVRLSVGLSHLQPHLTAEQVIQQADADMYASRREARMGSMAAVHAAP